MMLQYVVLGTITNQLHEKQMTLKLLYAIVRVTSEDTFSATCTTGNSHTKHTYSTPFLHVQISCIHASLLSDDLEN